MVTNCAGGLIQYSKELKMY